MKENKREVHLEGRIPNSKKNKLVRNQSLLIKTVTCFCLSRRNFVGGKHSHIFSFFLHIVELVLKVDLQASSLAQEYSLQLNPLTCSETCPIRHEHWPETHWAWEPQLSLLVQADFNLMLHFSVESSSSKGAVH